MESVASPEMHDDKRLSQWSWSQDTPASLKLKSLYTEQAHPSFEHVAARCSLLQSRFGNLQGASDSQSGNEEGQ